MRRLLAWLLALAVGAGIAGWIAYEEMLARTRTTLPGVRGVSNDWLIERPSPVRITITADWLKVAVLASPDRLLHDPALWRRMNFDDWDTVPEPLRRAGLERLVSSHRDVLRNPRRWDAMGAADWDAIPQPVRALAFMQMMRYWSGYYQVGADYGLGRRTVADTLNAILMVESWFEHRAVSISRSGNRDLGLGQTSDFARAALEQMHRRRQIDFAPADDAGYFNPWQATRMTALWFEEMLAEQRGDLDGAVRAYHRGSPLAMDEAGTVYLANVRQKRRRFMRDANGTPSWQLLVSLA